MSDLIEKLPLTSKDVNEDRLIALRGLFPEAFKEGALDWPTLQRSLGEWVDPGKERFGLHWPGKADCMKVIQQPSVGSLLPMRDESVNFDSTENLIIEGDNLEVLKLLQKSYYGKVKMIYIDPPYNTGNEFIYPDNFQEDLQDYLRYSGQVNSEGLKLSANTETDGRYHSKWLNMMYPRLFLAKNLLRDDGVIFVSIDDHEVAQLKLLMTELFGEENFITQIEWQKRYTRSNNTDDFTTVVEHILMYSKSGDLFTPNLLERDEEANDRYQNPDNDPRGPWKAVPFSNPLSPKERPNLAYPITNPNTGEVITPEKKAWRSDRETWDRLLRENRVWWGKDGTGSTPNIKRFLTEVKQGMTPINLWDHEFAGNTDQASKEIKEIFGDKVFDTAKPSLLIQRMLQIATSPDEGHIVLDFFAGSGTTARAVYEQNKLDNGNRKFVLIQLPERTPEKSPANVAGFETISQITLTRARREIDRLTASRDMINGDTIDLGFKALSLSTSNFKVWVADTEKMEDIGQSLRLFAEHVDEDRKAEDILYELLLKSGFPLTAPVEKLVLSGKETFSVSDGALLICLDRELSLEVIEAMVEKAPSMILCLDEGFKGNDQLKVNAVQTVKSRNQNDETDIVFRVV